MVSHRGVGERFALPEQRIMPTQLYQELLHAVSARLTTLPDKPEETPEGIVMSLWHLAAGSPMSLQLAGRTALPPLDDMAAARLRELVARRLSGVPLAHLTGRQQFMGLELLADRRALIPRRETELLGQSALTLLRDLATRHDQPTVIDVCTGSGNLAVALAYYVPQARLFASDLSPDAVELAKRNVLHLGLEKRVEVRVGDLLEPFDRPSFHGMVDLITCNPPYILSRNVDGLPKEISDHEPRSAFDGGPFGVKIMNRFIREAPKFLRRGGWIAFEVGLGQGAAILKRFDGHADYREALPITDDSGNIRGIMARV